MPESPESEENDWQKVWDARSASLSQILGKPADTVLHAPVPFQLGGAADVLCFPQAVAGMAYVTAELTGEDVGQIPNSMGNYELMICGRQELPAGANLISRLARYTCEAKLEPGESMDVGRSFGDSTIRALLFTHLRDEAAQFEFLGCRYGLLLCMGITAEELEFKQEHGSEKLLELLKQHSVFPFTIPGRNAIPLPRRASILDRIFRRS